MFVAGGHASRHQFDNGPLRLQTLLTEPHVGETRIDRPAAITRKVEWQDHAALGVGEFGKLFGAKELAGPGTAEEEQERPFRVLNVTGLEPLEPGGVFGVVDLRREQVGAGRDRRLYRDERHHAPDDDAARSAPFSSGLHGNRIPAGRRPVQSQVASRSRRS